MDTLENLKRWQKRTDAENARINLAFLRRHVVPAEAIDPVQHRVVFSHVPKTGGTTLEAVLGKHHTPMHTVHINAPDLLRLPGLLQAKKNPPSLICGHHPMHGLLYQLLPAAPLIHITLLRDPVDRVISHYNYVSKRSDHPMHARTRSMSFAAFIEDPHWVEARNGQARRLVGALHDGATMSDPDLLQQATEVLQQAFTATLVTELFDPGLLLLQKWLGLQDVHYRRLNTSAPRIAREELQPQTLQRLQQLNAVDAALHAHARQTLQSLIDTHLSPDALDRFNTEQTQWLEMTRGAGQ